MLAWSVLAIGYAVRRGSTFRWGMGGKGHFAPQWFGRIFFLTAGAYGLFWSAVTWGEDLGYLRSSSKPALALKFINSHIELLLVDGFLGVVFLVFAFHSFSSFRQAAAGDRARIFSLVIAVVAAAVGIFSLVHLTLRLMRL